MLANIRSAFGLTAIATLTIFLCPSAFSQAPPPNFPHLTNKIVFTAPPGDLGSPVPGGAIDQELFTATLDEDFDVAQLTNGRQLTSDGLTEFLPHYSPDGKKLVYTKFLEGTYGDPTGAADIYLYDFATAKETRLTESFNDVQAAWSPDGEHLAYGTIFGDALYVIDANGKNLHIVATPAFTQDDLHWDDFAWSNDNWIVFTVAQNINGCFKVRLDKIRPDGSHRTQVSDGGDVCTPPGFEQFGDADPGFSPDGKIIYSSFGTPPTPSTPSGLTVRHLYAYSSDAYQPGKTGKDLSIGGHEDCTAGVPKASPDGARLLIYLRCFADLDNAGITVIDLEPFSPNWKLVGNGFGADWKPAPQSITGRQQ